MNKIQLFLIVFFLGFFCALGQSKPYVKYKVEEGETIRSVCKKLSITPYKLLTLNPEIKDNDNLEGVLILIIPNKSYQPTSASGEHVDYIKDGFLYHKLLPKETYSKLKREYGVVKRQLRRFNSDLRFGGLKAGQIIKIPVKHDFKLPNANNIPIVTNNDDTVKPYLVKEKETKWRIARRYGISIEKLEELNPSIQDGEMQFDTIIMVPNTDEIPDISNEYVTHRIEKGENFFRLTKNFDVSEEELIALNPELSEGVKEGMVIKIPFGSVNSTEFTPNIIRNKSLNVVYLLPFMSNTNNVDFEKNITANIATDFYLGTSIALDSLRKHGVSVHIKTFDTQNNRQKIRSIFSALDLNNVDVIIGPMFYENIKLVSNLTRGKSIPIISPVSKKDHSVISYGNIVQEVPLFDELKDKILSYIKDNYTDQNIIVIGDDKKESAEKINNIASNLQVIDTVKQITLIKPDKGYIKPTLFREKLSQTTDNWVVLATDDAVVTRDVINNLGVLPEDYKTIFFGLNKGDNFDKQKDINHQLAHVNFHYPEYSFIDYENENVKDFIARYKRMNFADPSEYSFKGFDITYDILLRLASFENYNSALNAGSSERMSTKFNYESKTGNGFINKGVYLVKYDGLNLVKVN